MPNAQSQLVHVAVGVIVNDSAQVLIARRAPDAHQGGLLEFPGGKCEPGETVQRALARELQEELGISVASSRPLCVIQHDYGDKHVMLDVWVVDSFTGVPIGQEGQPLHWLDIDSLSYADFPAANRSIIAHLQLPNTIAITGAFSSIADYKKRLDYALDAGVPMLQMRAKTGLGASEFLTLADYSRQCCHARGSKFIVNTHQQALLGVEADGVHVGSELAATLQRRPVSDAQLFGVSCHDLSELFHAQSIGADYAFLSPVQATQSHPEAKPLGWQQFADLVAQVNLPVYALGGMTAADATKARACGGIGVASISAFWPSISQS
ncbi:MAG: Nudix family hydrolase [Pseudohongiellaceae bacterium]|nr:Nudix family hydrolase [Pseudohongiellaceae bacterium]